MGYISNNNSLINLLPLSTTQPHLLLTHNCLNVNDHHQLTNASSRELGDGKKNLTYRWNPTPEQITALEELYRSGTRNPTTEQIQKIASKLRMYGRIEGKNVFYWFQNHKARERLKRRRDEEVESVDINNVREPHKAVKDSSSDHGTKQKSEKASEDYKDAKWRNLVTWSTIQEPGEVNVNGEDDEEQRREIRTLNLFPVMENQEKTGGFIEKNQVEYCYYYEFMPLKN